MPEDLDFANDVGLLACRHIDQHEKANRFTQESWDSESTSQRRNTQPLTVNNQPMEEVFEFIYLGSKMSVDGDSEVDVDAKVSKANKVFGMLWSVWRFRKLSHITKLRFFSVLLYGCESWKMTQRISKKLDTFQTKFLRRIEGVYWPNTISNMDLLERTEQTRLSEVVREEMALVRTCAKNALPRMALTWKPQGKRRRGRPKKTWRRSSENELRDLGFTWATAKQRTLATAPCASQGAKGSK
ncbi:uncharacterized protein LOC102807067 [Saccoglossus kowalevskii]|uniref:Uncharacterized protein LOC102807067 n=1 Tax=Saccoglossus kowalevskii TaxID=10224 RepID=A0ABM0MGS7_SACKO|nr:PREDICTED: uncharacterized protein LOC102807067 [Saccoglossus kowalevskii]